MLVKICGLSNKIDATMAAELGADALGFVMGGRVLPFEVEPSAQLVREIIAKLPKRVETYIVSHLKNVQDLVDLSNYVRSSGIQVSESLHEEQLKDLRSKTDKKIIKTIPVEGSSSIDYLKRVEMHCDMLLLDSVAQGYIGGTGQENDWSRCAELIRVAQKPVFIAGGLHPSNVLSAIELTHPSGVDVSTGVSTYSEHYLRKDRKDPKAIEQFIKIAKQGTYDESLPKLS